MCMGRAYELIINLRSACMISRKAFQLVYDNSIDLYSFIYVKFIST